jgi:hypothetical protein
LYDYIIEEKKETKMDTKTIEVLNNGAQKKALLTIPKNTPVKDILAYLEQLKKMNISSVMIKVNLFHF